MKDQNIENEKDDKTPMLKSIGKNLRAIKNREYRNILSVFLDYFVKFFRRHQTATGPAVEIHLCFSIY